MGFREERGVVMIATLRKSLVLGMVLLLCASAFAANKGNLRLDDPVTVNGTTTTKPGDYKVQWEGNGPNVDLSLTQGKNMIAKSQRAWLNWRRPTLPMPPIPGRTAANRGYWSVYISRGKSFGWSWLQNDMGHDMTQAAAGVCPAGGREPALEGRTTLPSKRRDRQF
jgi:hypothetical protein